MRTVFGLASILFVSLFAISGAVGSLVVDTLLKREMVWDKTLRYRKGEAK